MGAIKTGVYFVVRFSLNDVMWIRKSGCFGESGAHFSREFRNELYANVSAQPIDCIVEALWESYFAAVGGELLDALNRDGCHYCVDHLEGHIEEWMRNQLVLCIADDILEQFAGPYHALVTELLEALTEVQNKGLDSGTPWIHEIVVLVKQRMVNLRFEIPVGRL